MGKLAVLIALAAAAWVLFRAGGGDASRKVFRLKVVGLLAVAMVLFAANLFPLALMILLAAGGVTAIELWRERAIRAGEDLTPGAGSAPARRGGPIGVDEAAAVLGVPVDASDEDVKAAHRKLISQLHPDKGGTDYLASKINEARKVMLDARGQRDTVNSGGDR